ncbi:MULTISPECIES: hypothetical protein [Corallincola]|nr:MULTISPECIES: hypothetical protein [Corallincola]
MIAQVSASNGFISITAFRYDVATDLLMDIRVANGLEAQFSRFLFLECHP